MIKISGLPAGAIKSDLEELFLPYGEITQFEIFTEDNKSIAHIALKGDIDAAVSELDGKPFRGQCILTVEAHPPYPGGTGGSYDTEKYKQAESENKNNQNSTRK